jgi:hypothetical protein
MITSKQHMRVRSLKALLFLFSIVALSSCALTRTETEFYTITKRDTVYREQVVNAPGHELDNGVVFPSSRVTRIEHQTTTYDSTHERRYPNFMRFGGVEFAGLMLTSSRPGIGPGLLGVYGLLDSNTFNEMGSALDPNPEGNIKSKIFKGHLFRLMPFEYRLRWFDDAPNWTWGMSLWESFQKDEEDGLSSWLNLYIRKRFYIRDKIPYMFVAPYVGFGITPSLYANAGAEAVFGSYGGFNLRGYLGVISGFQWADPKNTVTFPYLGLGVSALDFINKAEETEREWKDYVHNAIEVTMLDAQLLAAFAGYTNMFDTTVLGIPFTGSSMKFATAHFPVPLLDSNWWVGTSLFNYFALGFEQSTLSVLPIRAGYRKHLIADDLFVEPFIELNYYPSQYVNIGARLRLNTFFGIVVGLDVGYANGSSGAFFPSIIFSEGSPIGADFSSGYAGVSISLRSNIFTPDFVWKSRASEQ